MKSKSRLLSYLLLSLCLRHTSLVFGLTFSMMHDSDIVGAVQVSTVQQDETFADIGRRFDIGIYEMIEANPGIDPWNPPEGQAVVVPSQFILPSGPKRGMVINLAEMRIYFFHPDQPLVSTHPIGIGKKGWETPLGEGRITQKTKLPHWRPPQSIRNEYARHGKYLPDIVPPGPKNPLGKYSLRLSIPGYLIHGTNRPGGIGVRSSSGCIRLYPEDIKSLYNAVSVNTPVRIIHAPYKFGRHFNQVFVEAHEPLSDPYYNTQSSPAETLSLALEAATMDSSFVDMGLTNKAIKHSRGYPTLIR